MDMMADKKALKEIVKSMSGMGGKPKGMAITVEKVGKIGKEEMPMGEMAMDDDKWPMVKDALQKAKDKLPEEFAGVFEEVESVVRDAYYPYEKEEYEKKEEV